MESIVQAKVQVQKLYPLTVKNPKSGIVHEFWSDHLDDPTDGPRGRTACGIVLFDDDWEVGQDKVTCLNCISPGHGNLWPDSFDDWWGY